MAANKMPLVFISYRRADSSAASRWLAQTIRHTFGPSSVFVDTETIRIGRAYPEEIERNLSLATVLIAVIGKDWLTIADEFGRRRLDKEDDWVCNEIHHALQSKTPIIPVLLSSPTMPVQKALPPRIADLVNFHGMELRDSRWESDLSVVLDALSQFGFKRPSGESVRYPKPMLTLKELTEDELATQMRSLPDWTVTDSEIPGSEPKMRKEIHRSFEFASFEDAIAFMSVAVPKISAMDHHPRWQNIWRTVSVWLTTWDIGHKPSVLDMELAKHLDQMRKNFAVPRAKKQH